VNLNDKTDQTSEMTDQTEINFSPFLFAIMIPAKSKMEDNRNASN